jgi:hypothetical protein
MSNAFESKPPKERDTLDDEAAYEYNKAKFGDLIALCPDCSRTIVRSKRSGKFFCDACNNLFEVEK